MHSSVGRLLEHGQSPWYDNLTRALARGGLVELMERHSIRGVTSNPTIFEKAIAGSDAYDEQIRHRWSAAAPIEELYWDLVTDDIAHAADLLRGVHDATEGLDGYVSVEVDPRLARSTAATVEQADQLVARLDRPNVMIKVPATIEGLPAITELLARGFNVNVTLIFSLARYAAVIGAYTAGIAARRAAAPGGPLPVSVASFFVSRVDTETDRRLPEGHDLRGRAAVANAQLAYGLFRKRFDAPEWAAHAEAGARVQRPLWASTSTKNPAYSPTLYVDRLIGTDTVNTLADASLDALHGDVELRAGTILEGLDAAQSLLDGLGAAGVDFADVTDTLEREGVDAFASSFDTALATLAAKADALRS